MKKVSEYVYEHGASYWVRMRIPKNLKYPDGREEILNNLHTGAPSEAKARSYAVIARIRAEFADKRSQLRLSHASLSPKRIESLTEDELKLVGGFYQRSVLEQDQARRQAGLDDEEFDELGRELTAQRADLARLLAQGKSEPILGVLHCVLHLCGIDFQPKPEAARRAGFTFLRAVVDTLDKQLERQAGGIVDTDTVAPAVAHPLKMIAPECAPVESLGPTWDKVFQLWCEHGEDRPKSSIAAYRTPWLALKRFAASLKALHPQAVTEKMMSQFVRHMRKSGLAINTINERLRKIRYIFEVATASHELPLNPAARTLGIKGSTTNDTEEDRVPFDYKDLERIFSSSIFTTHARSRGQVAEASYLIPVCMYYSGMRPEELAGLALRDIVHEPQLGWFFDVYHRTEASERRVSPAERIPKKYWRKLKNNASVRRVPIAHELIELGLLRYVDWVRARGSLVLFPTLKKDCHGKLDGACVKFFSRYLRGIGITAKDKVLYSFRHTLKDRMEVARVPFRHMQRILGHAPGDGTTGKYGSKQLPFDQTAQYFREIKFPPIPALPWQPGCAAIRNKCNSLTSPEGSNRQGRLLMSTHADVRATRSHSGIKRVPTYPELANCPGTDMGSETSETSS